MTTRPRTSVGPALNPRRPLKTDQLAGNACGGTFPGTSLLGPCSLIEDGINTCHAPGKKVFLSLGGAAWENYVAPRTTAVANYFAEYLWGAFGPSSAAPPASWVAAGSQRPFGTASV